MSMSCHFYLSYLATRCPGCNRYSGCSILVTMEWTVMGIIMTLAFNAMGAMLCWIAFIKCVPCAQVLPPTTIEKKNCNCLFF